MIHLAADEGSPAELMHKSIEIQGKTLEFTYTEGSNVFAGISLEWMLLLIGEIERLRKISVAICIDFKQACDVLSMFGGEPGEVTLQIGEGHSGRGLYVHYSDYPEEGAEFLGVADEEAMPAAEAITPLTDERIRELWVEHGLDECDPEGFARIIEAELRGALAQSEPVQHQSYEAIMNKAKALGAQINGLEIGFSHGEFEAFLRAYGWPGAPVQQEAAQYLLPDDLAALERFIETTEDDQSYDIGKAAIKRLAELGAVQSHNFGRYSITAFGHWVHEKHPGLPLLLNSDRDARHRAALQPTQDAR